MSMPVHRDNVRKLFAERAESYEDYTAWRNDRRIISEILRPLSTLRQDARCLDLGGGTGRLARYGSEVAGQWFLADLSLDMLLAAPQRIPSVNADALSLPIRNGSIDFVAAWSSVSYVTDLPRVLFEVRRVLHDDGMVAVAEKVMGDYANETAARDWYLAIQRVRNPLKIQSLETAQLAATFKTSGLDVQSAIEVRGVYRQDYQTWLSRNGVLSEEVQQELDLLVRKRPGEVTELGFNLDDGILTAPVAWAVCTARKVRSRPARPAVITLAPVRRKAHNLEIYVQHRNAPVASEPEFVGWYEFPQGHIDLGESVATAAVRELAEEAGLSIRRVIGGDQLSTISTDGLVGIESSQPELVVMTSGRLGHIALLFVVEVARNPEPVVGAVDNRGAWRSIEEFRNICLSDRIYPLNQPMFQHVLRNLNLIDSALR